MADSYTVVDTYTESELNAAVTEKVMNRRYTHHERVKINDKWREADDIWWPEKWDPENPPPGVTLSDYRPSYCTDIKMAWFVMERMMRLGRHLYVGPNDAGNLWICEYGRWSYAWGETAPLAICRAALKAMG